MIRSLLVVDAFVLVTLGLSLGQSAEQSPAKAESADYKISQENLDRKNPVKTSPEGLAEAKKVFGYDCEMCHGAHGDGKGDLVESMKLTVKDWRDPAALAGKTDGEIFYIITKGKGKMIGEGDRQSEKLRWNLVNLVRSMAGKAAEPPKPAEQKPATTTP
jgi:mono/diheme cytochrome c family protein